MNSVQSRRIERRLKARRTYITIPKLIYTHDQAPLPTDTFSALSTECRTLDEDLVATLRLQHNVNCYGVDDEDEVARDFFESEDDVIPGADRCGFYLMPWDE